MAKNDELDIVLSDSRIHNEEWKALGEILEIKDILALSNNKRCETVNRELRHSFGQTVMNIRRTPYEPNYVSPILLATADKLKITISTFRVEDIEDKIIIKVIEMTKEQIIKDRGQEAWNKIEKEVQDQLDERIQSGKIPQNLADEFKKLSGSALVAALLAGRFAGFELYIIANQVLDTVAKGFGIGIGIGAALPFVGGIAFLLGPGGIIFAGIMGVLMRGNTNWKKVIPAVVMVAAIRKRLAFEG